MYVCVALAMQVQKSEQYIDDYHACARMTHKFREAFLILVRSS